MREFDELELVFPEEARCNHCISVLSPVGSALIGLGPGQSIRWTEQGRERSLAVLEVRANGRGSDDRGEARARAAARRSCEEHRNPTTGLEHGASIFYDWALDPLRR